MTRSIQLHPLSLLVGVGFALLGVVAMGQVPAAKRPAAAHDSGLLQVAHPRDWIVIQDGQPFTVPPGKLLVITALGHVSHIQFSARLVINGSDVVTGYATQNNQVSTHSSSMAPIEIGLRAAPGDVVEAIDLNWPGSARAWGYLVDA